MATCHSANTLCSGHSDAWQPAAQQTLCAVTGNCVTTRALQVRMGGAQQSPYLEALKKAEERAQLAGLGVWTKVWR